MRGYLIDTNHVPYWAKPSPTFAEHLNSKPPEYLMWISAVALGEVEWGLSNYTTDVLRRSDYEQFIARVARPQVKEIRVTTCLYYAKILRRLWDKYPPPSSRSTEAHLATLGVDVNDVWIVASAWEHGLTLLTQDKMQHIREVVTEVTFESWI